MLAQQAKYGNGKHGPACHLKLRLVVTFFTFLQGGFYKSCPCIFTRNCWSNVWKQFLNKTKSALYWNCDYYTTCHNSLMNFNIVMEQVLSTTSCFHNNSNHHWWFHHWWFHHCCWQFLPLIADFYHYLTDPTTPIKYHPLLWQWYLFIRLVSWPVLCKHWLILCKEFIFWVDLPLVVPDWHSCGS